MNVFLEAGKDASPLDYIFGHALDHRLVNLGWFSISQLTIAMWVASAILVLIALKAEKKTLVPRGLCRGVLEQIYLFIRNEIVYPTMGEHNGKAFMPFFMTIFCFIFTLNLYGMIPLPGIGGSSASTLGFTLPMAVMIFGVAVVAGISHNGFGGFLHGFIPPGLPGWLTPVIFLLEIAGFFIKHGVLAIRLFANMLAGHLVIGALLGLIFLFKMYVVAAISVPLALFISFLELLVAFLQAYVFTLLSVLFIGGTVHPEH